ncbi:MAG TPA: hypothetical protein VFT31_08390 [Kribbella sp.]|nr:hypothetical protein [Kribbella sp.]
MTGIAVLGEPVRTLGYVLAGAMDLAATEPAQVRRRWAELPPSVEVVLLTQAAAAALGPEQLASAPVLTVVLPS